MSGRGWKAFYFQFLFACDSSQRGYVEVFPAGGGVGENHRLVVKASAISLGSGGPREPAGSLGCWAPRFSLRISLPRVGVGPKEFKGPSEAQCGLERSELDRCGQDRSVACEFTPAPAV